MRVRQLIIAIMGLCLMAAQAQAADIEASFSVLDDGRYKSYVEVGHKFDLGLRPYVSIATNMDEWTGTSFHPDNVTYIVGAQYYLGQFILSAYHLCSHPVDRYADVLEYNAVKITWIYGK